MIQIQGIPIPLAALTIGEAAAGAYGETADGSTYRSDLGPDCVIAEFETPPLANAVEVALLLAGAGEVWSESDYGSKGTLLENPLSAAGSAKFGSNSFDASAAPVDALDLTTVPGLELGDGWTVLVWFNDGGGYVHWILTSAGDVFEDGAASYNPPFTVDSAGMLSFDIAGDFDDLVVLPYVIPATWPALLDLTQAFAALPELNASGDFWHEAITVEPGADIELTAILGVTHWGIRGTLIEVP